MINQQENGGINDFLSLFDNSYLDDSIDIDFLETRNQPLATTTMNEDTRRNLRRIQEKTVELEKERRGIKSSFFSLARLIFNLFFCCSRKKTQIFSSNWRH